MGANNNSPPPNSGPLQFGHEYSFFVDFKKKNLEKVSIDIQIVIPVLFVFLTVAFIKQFLMSFNFLFAHKERYYIMAKRLKK